MGGRETVRGILFQSLICCQEIFSKSWTLVHFEPTFQEGKIEKVDILFIDENNKQHALQVKSSIKKFGEAAIVSWINELKRDIDADYYELQLVGDLKENAKSLVETINESDNTRVKLNAFNIDGIENDILNKAKNFLEKRNIGSDNKILMSNIKIICYELLKSSLDNKNFSIENIFDMLTDKDNEDLKEFCQLIKNRLDKRVGLILSFYRKTFALYGFGTRKSNLELRKIAKNIQDINNEYEMEISNLLKNIEPDEKFYAYLCKEYLLYEEKSIENFLSDLYTPQSNYFEKNKLTYHLQLRTKINQLLSMFNNIDEKISNKYFLTKNQKELFETQDDIKIKYNDLNNLGLELGKLTFKEQQFPMVEVFTDNNEIVDLIKGSINTEICLISVLNDQFTQKQMYDYIVSRHKAFTDTGSYSPQLNIRYLIFVFDVSEEIKIKLEEFKNKSTIKYIFVERE
ncbi:TPA: hypothetical protein ACSVZR_003220 [Bacillus cereus]